MRTNLDDMVIIRKAAQKGSGQETPVWLFTYRVDIPAAHRYAQSRVTRQAAAQVPSILDAFTPHVRERLEAPRQ